MFSIVDCNNFWSPSGGGVRRYHLEKMEFYKNREDVHYTFIMHDDRTFSEQIGSQAFIEHVQVPKVMGNWEYRYLVRSHPLRPILARINPDVIEVGSPYFMPGIVRHVVSKEKLRSKVFGFWHADFPVTYVRRFLEPLSESLAAKGEKVAWRHARRHYNRMAGVMVSSEVIRKRMISNGMRGVEFLPLGVDAVLFSPDKKDDAFREKYQAGNPERLILFFPHRLSKEKGLDKIIEAYPLLCEKLNVPPALVIAGMGLYERLARDAAEKYEHVHFIGFVKGKEEMARCYSSSDLGFALSKWETFGLSLLESMSCGLPLVAANDGAAYEHVDGSKAGYIISNVEGKDIADAVKEYEQLSDKGLYKARARRYAQRLTWHACFEKQLEIYGFESQRA